MIRRQSRQHLLARGIYGEECDLIIAATPAPTGVTTRVRPSASQQRGQVNGDTDRVGDGHLP
jgi:hypothetical protein